ncbi:MAG: TetR/AcrR family transcriptional regulator [Pseudomonadota bacterium]
MKDASSDGRRRRSEQSRAKIVDSMLLLVKEGIVEPTAEEVAMRAQIGLRSVFRHFSDMETLRREMVGQLATQYAKWLTPFVSVGWRNQLDELLVRRTTAYDEIYPFKRAADAYRHRSPSIAEEYDRVLTIMRMRLRSSLPPSLADDETMFEAVDGLLSYEFWQRLRSDQKLSTEAARNVVEMLLRTMLLAANVPADEIAG